MLLLINFLSPPALATTEYVAPAPLTGSLLWHAIVTYVIN